MTSEEKKKIPHNHGSQPVDNIWWDSYTGQAQLLEMVLQSPWTPSTACGPTESCIKTDSICFLMFTDTVVMIKIEIY